jgi:putative sterol carrier protein
VEGFDTAAMAQMVRSVPDEQLEQGLRANGEQIIGEVFRRFPDRLSEEGRRADAVIKWKIRPKDGEDQRWFVVLENGECTTGRDLDRKPDVTLSLRQLDFLKLVTGNANPVQMFLTRRLRIRGDLMLASRMQRFFEVPS